MADLMKERATRADILFGDVMQAELLIFVTSAISDAHWYPRTLIYAGFGNRFPLFVRATQHRFFEKLKVALGVASANELRERFSKGFERLNVGNWQNFWIENVSFSEAANLDLLDTIK